MRAEDHYAALGLRPGASRAEIDDAYRRLIKRYHPDRTDGDCRRAAEINRAHTQLTRHVPAPQPPRRRVPVPAPAARPRSGRRAAWAVAGVLAAVGAGYMAADSPTSGRGHSAFAPALSWPKPVRLAGSGRATPLADFDEPLNTALVDRSIADAVRFYRAGDLAATVAFSRACHNQLRDNPSLAWFDSCAAFDEATALLESDNALAESGPFGASALVARHMASARILARDMLDADSRVQEIRTRVEFELLPRIEEGAAAAPRRLTLAPGSGRAG